MSLAKTYSRLPEWLQPAAIWAYGWHLKRVRTGGVYRQALAEFAARDSYSTEQWREWQNAALTGLLHFAVERVPYYRELHAAGRYPIEDVHSVEDLWLLPTITKWEVYHRPTAFLADGVRISDLLAETTSGTTGTPLTLYLSRATNQRWYAAAGQRMLRWHGLHEGMRYATIGAQPAVPTTRQRPPFWRYNPFGRQLYLPVYHIKRANLDSILDAVHNYRLAYLYGYGSALDVLACHALETGRDDVRLAMAFSNAEPFGLQQRQRVERAFGCGVADTYAACEKTFGCYEYGGTMYVSPDLGVLEIIRPDGTQADAGEVGEVCGTGLLNPDFVLIRYRQADRAALAPAGTPGAGGFQMPIVRQIDGRDEDVLVTPDGREVRWAGVVFKTNMRIREAQIVQTALDQVEARVVPAAGFNETVDGGAIREELRERLGPSVAVHVRCVAELPRLPNGKFRTVIREFPRPPRHGTVLATSERR